MTTTINKREVTEQYSDSPVTRVRIKRNELVLRYSKTITDERADEIYDTIMSLEKTINRDNPTIRIKILDTDDLNTIQCEIGNTESQIKLIKTRGVDY